MPLLEIENVSVSFAQYSGWLRQTWVQPLQHVTLSLEAGEIVAVIGASGSGKSLLAHAIMGILPKNAHVGGSMRYNGTLLDADHQARLRGRELALVPQSVNYLDPLMRVGPQVSLTAEGKQRAKEQREVFARYQLDESVEQLYPFELSGGMARRVLVSTAAISGARVIIADEPTPGMQERDVAETRTLFRDLARNGAAVLFITHDIATAAQVADRVAVMHGGSMLETVSSADFGGDGSLLHHPYTRALWQALPQNGFTASQGETSLGSKAMESAVLGSEASYSKALLSEALGSAVLESAALTPSAQTQSAASATARAGNTAMTLLEGRGLGFRYDSGEWLFRGLDVAVQPGEAIGILGPSGCGKTTLGRILAGLDYALEGSVAHLGRPLSMKTTDPCPVQMVLQHPEKAVNPRWRLKKTLAEAWMPDDAFLERLGIQPSWLERWPNELSGGELQRICIARALAPSTRFLIADEMTTMLDAITQAQIWQAVMEIAAERGLGLVVISHDPALLQRVTGRIIPWDQLTASVTAVYPKPDSPD